MLSITLTNVNLFAGVGGSLDEHGTLTDVTDDTITTAGAIGFAVTSGTVKVAVVRPAGLGALDKTSYFGMEVSLAGASLVGVEGLTFKATGTVLVNRATDAAGAGAVERINWATATDTASALPVFSAKLTKLVELKVDGSVHVWMPSGSW